MKNKQLWTLVILMIVISMVLSACGAAEPTQAPESTKAAEAPAATEVEQPTEVPQPTDVPEPRVLRIRLDAPVQNLDRAFRYSGSDGTVHMAVMEGLLGRKASEDKQEVELQLAEWIEPSEDGLEVHFKLKEGVMWQGGYGEVTTDDVKFSFERFLDPELAAAYADDWAALDHVEIIDKYEGKIVLKEPQATLLTTTLPGPSGLIISKKQVDDIGNEGLVTEIAGTGPYLLGEWLPNEKLVLEPNPDYRGEPAYWDEIHLFFIEDEKAAEVALEAGEIDFSLVSLVSADRFEDEDDFEVQIKPYVSYSWIGMNVENPKLEDINVRQAIRYGIDVPSILLAAYGGRAEQAKTMILPGMTGYWEDAPVYERDVEKAKEYMAAAGLESLDLELAILDTAEFRTWAEIAQQNLAEIGINITITPLDPSAFWVLGDGDKGKDAELFTMTYTGSPDPAFLTMWFTCQQVGVWNWMRWCNSEYDELNQKGITTLDEAVRDETYIEMEQIWDEAVHTVWVTHAPVAMVNSTEIEPALYPNMATLLPIHEFRLSE